MTDRGEVLCPCCGADTKGIGVEISNFNYVLFFECAAKADACGPFAVICAPFEMRMKCGKDGTQIETVPIETLKDLNCPECNSELMPETLYWRGEHGAVPYGWVAFCSGDVCGLSVVPHNGWNLDVQIRPVRYEYVLLAEYDMEVLEDEHSYYESWLDGDGPAEWQQREEADDEPNSRKARLFRRRTEAGEEYEKALQSIGVDSGRASR